MGHSMLVSLCPPFRLYHANFGHVVSYWMHTQAFAEVVSM
jgi:hypothetical protein